MLLKLAALGALGYAGYRYYQKNMGDTRSARDETAPDPSDPRTSMAGGPLSEEATVVEAGEPLPAT